MFANLLSRGPTPLPARPPRAYLFHYMIDIICFVFESLYMYIIDVYYTRTLYIYIYIYIYIYAYIYIYMYIYMCTLCINIIIDSYVIVHYMICMIISIIR